MAQTIRVSLVDVFNKLDVKMEKTATKIDALEDKLEIEIDKLDKNIDASGERLNLKITHFNSKIDTVERRFNHKIDQLNTKIDDVEKRHNTKFDTLAKNLEDKIDQKFSDINARLNTIIFGFFGLVGVLVTGLLGILIKAVFFPNI